jgi:molybdopterin synthase catalytic subunit
MATSSQSCHPCPGDDSLAARVAVGIVHTPLDVGKIMASVVRPEAGGIGSFVGTTRDSFKGRTVTRLEYECYEPLAEKSLRRIAQACCVKYSLSAIAIWHRVGSVPVSESSVVIAASSPHRRECLEATQAAIAAVKAKVPIWKSEWYEGDDRCWKENCECVEAAMGDMNPARLRKEGAQVDVEAWLGGPRTGDRDMKPCEHHHLAMGAEA